MRLYDVLKPLANRDGLFGLRCDRRAARLRTLTGASDASRAVGLRAAVTAVGVPVGVAALPARA